MRTRTATHPNSPAYRLHPHPNSSTSTSNNSSVNDSINSPNHHDYQHHPQATNTTTPTATATPSSMPHFLSSFWKADGGLHTPIAYSSSNSTSSMHHSARHQRRWLRSAARYSNLIWMYAKWPLAALLACSVVATLVYFALLVNSSADDGEDDNGVRLPQQQQHSDRDMTNEDFVRFTQNAMHHPSSHYYEQRLNPIDNDDVGYDIDIANRTAQLLQLLDAVDASNKNDHDTDEVINDEQQRHQQQLFNHEPESISGRLAIFVQTPSATGRATVINGGNSHTDNRGNSIAQNAHFNDDLLLDFPLSEEPQDYDHADVAFPLISAGEHRSNAPITTHTTSVRPAPSAPVTQPVALTTKRFRNTQIIEISTPKHYQQSPGGRSTSDSISESGSSSGEIESGEQPQQQRPRVDSTLMFPTRETFEIFGFTSGHQNSFGVPIEEDERMLRVLNEQLLQQSQTQQSSTTDSTMTTLLGRTHVSPTLPNLRSLAVTTERLSAFNQQHKEHDASLSSSSMSTASGDDEGICESSALPLCRSVLPYDLTSAEHSRSNLTRLDVEHFKYLVESRCSPRAHEFICSVLQPECRPERMGILQPCKRSCKAILEPCGHVIAASEFLTAAFDCDSFPDSHDPEECRDATRDAACMANEFQCDDRSCVPQQWRCDNIKDCVDAEDEIECKFCQHDEFRCPTVDKCIPDKWRCDDYDDCPDAADEADCEPYDDDENPDESRTLTTSLQGHGRTFPYTQELSASRAAIGITSTPRPPSSYYQQTATATAAAAMSSRPPTTTTTNNNGRKSNELTTSEDGIDSQHRDELLAEESGVALPLPKNLANFQDSKEIMMTSDSENDFKYATRSTLAGAAGAAIMSSTLGTIVGQQQQVPSTATKTTCPTGELRCISGKCITVNQLCDKVADCPDAADEAMCVYKEASLDVQ